MTTLDSKHDDWVQMASWANVRDDTDRCWEEFLQDSSRLFVEKDDRITRIEVTADSQVRTSHTFPASVSEELIDSRVKHVFYLIEQGFSWDRFLVSHETFKRIIIKHDVFAPFLDFVRAFGRKTKEDEHVNDGFYRSCEISGGRQEVCYNLRYLERNNRNSGDPWSLRQMGVYQSYDFKTGDSVWIILQPSTHIINRLVAAVQALEAPSMGTTGFSALHTLFLSFTQRYWKDHLDALLRQIEPLDEKASHSTVGKFKPHDYSVAFSDCQKLHVLKTKLQRLNLVVDASLDISSGLKSHFNPAIFTRTSEREDGVASQRLIEELQLYSTRLRASKRRILSMMDRVSSTNDLMFKILEFRNDESMTSASHGTQTNVSILRQIAFQTQQESAALSALTLQGQKEGRSLKALTLIATMYLPASLVATVFSSTLIQPQDDGGGLSGFTVSPKFWIYVLATIGLTLTTVLSTQILERWLQKRQ